jgi:hypothetical protein
MLTNKELVAQSKEILTKFGYDVKNTHLHELFARLSGYNNLHSAKAKGVNFADLFSDGNETKPLVFLTQSPALNQQIGSIKPETLTLVSGQAERRTSFLVDLGVSFLIQGLKVAYLNLNSIDRDEIIYRFIAGLSGISYDSIKNSTLTDAENSKIVKITQDYDDFLKVRNFNFDNSTLTDFLGYCNQIDSSFDVILIDSNFNSSPELLDFIQSKKRTLVLGLNQDEELGSQNTSFSLLSLSSLTVHVYENLSLNYLKIIKSRIASAVGKVILLK